ncbi:MAG TPA: hypothetical protein VFQ76_05720 [Longimicrobiaceae bacterium]|nr:hypothetical protein [Longimicrobiaceae bacterium]
MSRVSVGSTLQSDPGDPEAVEGFRGFVDPDHPLVANFFPPSAGMSRRTLEIGLSAARQRLRYRPRRGRRSLTTIHQDLVKGDAAAEANCLSVCCVLVSYLRRAGFGPDEALVAVGGMRGHAHFHAWVLVPNGAGFWWIDPARLELETAPGADIWRLHTLHALFNDRRLRVRGDEMRDFLLAGGGQEAQRSVVFGPGDATLDRLLSDPGLRRVFARFLAAEPCPAGEASEPTLRAASERGLVRLGADRIEPGSHLVVIPARAIAGLAERIAPSLAHYRRIVEDALPRVREAFSRTAAARRFAWSDVVHALAAGALMDLQMGRRLAQAGEGLEQQSGESHIWVFAGQGAENAYGVQCFHDPDSGYTLGQVWHRRVKRELRVPSAMIGRLARLATEGAGALDPRTDLYLRHLRLVEGHGGGRQAAIPVFSREDWSILSTPVAEAAERLVTTAVVPAVRSLEPSSWWGPRLGQIDVRHAAVRLILEHAADEVVQYGILPRFPDAAAVPSSWGRWLWPAAPGAHGAGGASPAGSQAA